MIKVNLRDILHEGQEYVADVSEELRRDVIAVRHEVATDTCFEKADLLGWSAERVIKAVLLANENGNGFYGFVFPELGTFEFPRYIVKKETLPKLLSITSSQAKKFRNYYVPGRIEFGTSTPFLHKDLFLGNDRNSHKTVERMFIHDYPDLENQVVDISIGGEGEDAHKVSLHLRYGDIYDILSFQFKNKIQKVDLFF